MNDQDTLSFSVLITHFGDSFWVKNAIRSLNLTKSEFKIFVLDNQGDFPEIEGLQVIPTYSMVDGQDSQHHAYALDWALNNLDFITDYILILDSDVMGLGNADLSFTLKRILKSFGAIVALREGSRFLSHPCFLLFPSNLSKEINISEGMREFGFDTGTLIGLQLARKGLSILRVSAEKSPKSPVGYLYKDIECFHLTSSSLSYTSRRFKPDSVIWKIKVGSREKIAQKIVEGTNVTRATLFALTLKTSLNIFFWLLRQKTKEFVKLISPSHSRGII